MSSLAAARADNFYYPPGWDPSKGSLNSYHGQHPLRERARMLSSEGILVIRFEMPFNVWCLHCNSHIGKGVRYNAWKKAVGKYHSTIIYEFSMKCARCDGIMVIRTDPEHAEYTMVSGVRRKHELWEADDNEHSIKLDKDEDREERNKNPMAAVEHQAKDQKTVASASSIISRLQSRNSRSFSSSSNLLSLARSMNRQARDTLKAEAKAGDEKWKGAKVLMKPLSADDIAAANDVLFKPRMTESAVIERNERERERSSSSSSSSLSSSSLSSSSSSGRPDLSNIFSSSSSSSSSSSTSSSSSSSFSSSSSSSSASSASHGHRHNRISSHVRLALIKDAVNTSADGDVHANENNANAIVNVAVAVAGKKKKKRSRSEGECVNVKHRRQDDVIDDDASTSTSSSTSSAPSARADTAQAMSFLAAYDSD